MNAHARKWVEALRSGEFAQTQYVLRDHKGYCCLGVACELYRRETGNGSWEGPRFRPTSSSEPTGGTLPQEVADWLGINAASGYNHSSRPRQLSEDNDKGGASFAEIADIIDSEPSGLFA